MSVKIRLSRHGAKKNPFYRIVVSDERSPRDGKYIEQLGTYAPRGAREGLNVNHEKVQSWIQRGAKPTKTVSDLIAKQKKAV